MPFARQAARGRRWGGECRKNAVLRVREVRAVPGRMAKNDADWRGCGGKPVMAPEWSWPRGEGSRDPQDHIAVALPRSAHALGTGENGMR
jgi:hypothetical protein